MSAGNYISHFGHLADQGKMTEEEAVKQLKELHEIDMMFDEFDRQMCERVKNQNNTEK